VHVASAEVHNVTQLFLDESAPSRVARDHWRSMSRADNGGQEGAQHPAKAGVSGLNVERTPDGLG
jgi:hypothetical protein